MLNALKTSLYCLYLHDHAHPLTCHPLPTVFSKSSQPRGHTTQLHRAARAGQLNQVAVLLISHPADLNQMDEVRAPDLLEVRVLCISASLEPSYEVGDQQGRSGVGAVSKAERQHMCT